MTRKIWKSYKPRSGDAVIFKMKDGLRIAGIYLRFRKGEYYCTVDSDYRREFKFPRDEVEYGRVVARGFAVNQIDKRE